MIICKSYLSGGVVALLFSLSSLEVASQEEQTSELANLVENVKQQLPLLGRGTASFYLENDLFNDTDRNYTNGVRISLSSPNLEGFNDQFIENEQFRRWYQMLNEALVAFHPVAPSTGKDSIVSSQRVVLTVGQQIFTPTDKEATELIEDDRPYAAWSYVGTYYHARRGKQLKTVGVNLGLVGPAALGQESQDLIHDLRGIDKFKGWDNGLNNELGVQLVFEKKDKLLSVQTDNFGYDFISHYGGSLGNVATYLNVGGELRLGWHIPDDFGTSSLRSGADNHTPDGEVKSGWGMHTFLSLDGRWVARDIFLDGNTFSDSHSVDKRNWVADAAIGVSLTYEKIKLSYAQVLRTREFEQQEKSHSYGSLSVALDYQF